MQLNYIILYCNGVYMILHIRQNPWNFRGDWILKYADFWKVIYESRESQSEYAAMTKEYAFQMYTTVGIKAGKYRHK